MRTLQFEFLSNKNRERYLRIISPVGHFLGRLGIHPNVLSVTGLILSALAGLVFSTGSFFWGAWVVVLAGTCDALDGTLARETNKASKFGAFFDSILDRFGEILIFLGLAWHFSGGGVFLEGGKVSAGQSPVAVLLIVLAITGSIMVSYTRARAEGLGLTCNVGFMQRPERITLLVIGALLGSIPLIGGILIKVTLLVLAVLSNFTALQRIVHVRNQLLRESHSQ